MTQLSPFSCRYLHFLMLGYQSPVVFSHLLARMQNVLKICLQHCMGLERLSFIIPTSFQRTPNPFTRVLLCSHNGLSPLLYSHKEQLHVDFPLPYVPELTNHLHNLKKKKMSMRSFRSSGPCCFHLSITNNAQIIMRANTFCLTKNERKTGLNGSCL